MIPAVFRKILIANRGEVAIRIARACREMGIPSVAVYSEADRTAPHVHMADEAVDIGPAPSRDSYLNAGRIIEAAKHTGAEAIHPGYGFLSENPKFAEAVEAAGLVFIGPPPSAITAMGNKTGAKGLVRNFGVPVTPSIEKLPADPVRLAEAAAEIGYPLIIKAVHGGGGKGMQIVRSPESLAKSIEAAGRTSKSAFGDGAVFVERYVERPRHVEVQVLGDRYGNLIHLGERECSIQRRHQKIIEECPSPAVESSLRSRLTAAALAVARSVGYSSAGTVEFLVDDEDNFYFLEMNTRLQVEHPVTEWVYDVDVVEAQIRIAAGEPLWIRQEEATPRGHAIECRICAEDPAQGFLPCSGTIERVELPGGPGVRVDSGIVPGTEIPVYYDSLLAKLSVWAADRHSARRRMLAALEETTIEPVTTNLAFLADVIRDRAFVTGQTHTGFLEERFPSWPRSGSV